MLSNFGNKSAGTAFFITANFIALTAANIYQGSNTLHFAKLRHLSGARLVLENVLFGSVLAKG